MQGTYSWQGQNIYNYIKWTFALKKEKWIAFGFKGSQYVLVRKQNVSIVNMKIIKLE